MTTSSQPSPDPAPSLEPLPADLAALRQEFPAWRFGNVWATAASGPDRRRVTAIRGGVLLSAWSAAELAADIRREEATHALRPGR